jgi:uncharacterized lipoprotein YddW (UPF0748 family)
MVLKSTEKGTATVKNMPGVIVLCVLCHLQMVTAAETTKAVRGVWLTNVDSQVLNSRENILRAVDLCSSLGVNTIFVVTWNKTMTTYPSKTMKQLTGVEIDTLFTGRDPLRELIDAAHKKDIKVIAWFEFGFSASYKQQGGLLLKAKPEWAALDVHGNLVTKNGFDWMNGFKPEVQDFMMSLIMEVVMNYDVDGIQGDDRLPAMPSESGYDPYTVALYASGHEGKPPPENSKDSAWVQWRADILNAFMERIHRTVKAYNRNIIIAMSPSIYPWSKEEYLQDWPAWVRRGLVDMVNPQVYRYEFSRYADALNDIVRTQVAGDQLFRCYPGILLKLGDYSPSKKFLSRMLRENRKHGITGEVMFFYEGLARHADVFREFYREKVEFPSLLD